MILSHIPYRVVYDVTKKKMSYSIISNCGCFLWQILQADSGFCFVV